MYVEKPNKNKDLNISKVRINCDEIICDSKGRTVPYPLMKTAFAMVINGFSGSGKTTILMNLLTRKNKNYHTVDALKPLYFVLRRFTQ